MVWGFAGISTGPLSVSTVRMPEPEAPASLAVPASPEPEAVSVALEAQPPSTGVSAAMPRKAAKVRRERGAMVSSFLFVDEIS